VLSRLEFESDTQQRLEDKINALEERLREFENSSSAHREQFANLQENLCETNRIIKELEGRNNHIKPALLALGILFASSAIICFPHQSYDLFTSIYTIGMKGLNALLANPLLHRL
jgi:hypothetical protein